jgi:tetratricopeptide (TPR) repeat protein
MAKITSLSILYLGLSALTVLAQQPAASPSNGSAPQVTEAGRKADAYYNFAMGHLYTELSNVYGNRKEFVDQAIDYYREALKADPDATFLNLELSDLLMRSGRVTEALAEAEQRVASSPDDLEARRTLGRIYTRLIGDPNARGGNVRGDGVNEEMLRKAIEQHEYVVKAAPTDVDSQLLLGRLYSLDRRNVDAEDAFKKVLALDAENETAMRELARVYTSLGDTNRAIEMLTQVNSRNPSLQTLVALAGAYEQIRAFDKAAEVYEKALEAKPDDLDLLKRRAQALLYGDQLEAARVTLEQITSRSPQDVEAFLRLSQIYRQQGNFEKARVANNRAKELAPNNLEILYNDVNLLDAEGKTAEAIEQVKRMIGSMQQSRYTDAERTTQSVLLERLGLLERSAERYSDAVATFHRLAELNPESAGRAYAQIVETYRMAKEFDKAEAAANQAYSRFPDDRALVVVRASLLADLGKGDAAVRDMEAFLKGKEDYQNLITLAQIYEKTRRYPDMAKTLNRAEELAENDDERQNVVFLRGAMFERQKRFDEAEKEFRKVLAASPDNAAALNYLGYMLADRNVRLEEAYELIKKAVDLDPGNAAYLDSLGWVYFRMGKLTEAELALKQALQRYSNDPTIHDHLGDVYFEQGNLRLAVAQWETALKEWRRNAPSDRDEEQINAVVSKVERAKVSLARQGSEKKDRP